jgi:prepilin-type N-terminal cleavage/methylation domain-containing protein
MNLYVKKNKAFTLIELLVVISIISLLSSVVLSSLNNARSRARDAKRVSDIRAVGLSLNLYYHQYGTFCVHDAGSGGRGWLNSRYSSSYGVAQQLVNLGYLSAVPRDPTQGDFGYMIWCDRNNFTLWATLEKSSTLAECHFSSYDTGYGKNYCISQ